MTRRTLDDVVVVLVGTRHPGNVGSVARAMHNMGMSRLRLAAPSCAITEESFRLARSGGSILQTAKAFRSLPAALRGLRLVVGTTGKTGGNREQVYSPRELAPRIVAHVARSKVAVVFGPEDTGLVDSDLLRCQMLLRIPTAPKARSINLAQAVMIVAYECFLASLARQPERVPDTAPFEQLEAMYAQLEEALLAIGYLHPQNSQHMMFALRRVLGRAGLERADVGILRGMARQIAWCASRMTGAKQEPEATDVAQAGDPCSIP